MAYNRLIVLLSTVVLSLILTDCTGRRQTFHSELGNKSELVVAMDIDLPGYSAIGGDRFGRHYDILQAYADKLGMTLRIITGNTHAQCLQMLEEGTADIVASLADNPGETGATPIYTTSHVILASPEKQRERGPISLQELSGCRIMLCSGFKASKHYHTVLERLGDSPVFISGNSSRELIAALAANEYDYLICEKGEALQGAKTYPELQRAYDFSDEIQVTLALNPGVKGLKDDFTQWLDGYRAEQKLAYAQNTVAAESRNAPKRNHRISQYDDVIRSVADREGLDWRFLSAIAYHESRFKSHVVSGKGAQGIMQIMPVVARNFNVPEEEVAEPETNVLLAAKLLKNIEKSIQLPEATPYEDKMSIVLACYNAGVGHIADARRLAKKYGRSAHRWEDVSHFLQLKSQPEYYGDEVVRNGIFNGSKQTLAFVRNVMGQYDSYCLLAQR